MRRVVGRLVLILALLFPVWLSSGAALAAPLAPTSPAPLVAHPPLPPAARGGALALVALRPQAVQATCTASSSVKDCADALLTPGNRLLQILVVLILEAAGAATLVVIMLSLFQGIVGVTVGEPRTVAHVGQKIGGSVVLLVGMILVPVFLPQLLAGSTIQFQLPNIQQLIPVGS